MHFIWKSPKFCFIFFLSYKQNRICRDDAVNMLNQWRESPSYLDHPSCTSLQDRACFMYTEHWSTAPPFFTLPGLQLDTIDPIRYRQQPAFLTHIYTLTPTNTHATALGWPENEGDSAHSGWKGSHITVKCKIMTCQAESNTDLPQMQCCWITNVVLC